jgi:hypothetical protein
MPSMADITVKKYDEVTNITYTQVSPSAGDSVAAQWRLDAGYAAGVPIGLRRTFGAMTKWNGAKSARHFDTQFVSPFLYQDTTTGLYGAKDRMLGSSHIVLPTALSTTEIQEAVSQYLNLLASALMKSVGHTGYAPT